MFIHDGAVQICICMWTTRGGTIQYSIVEQGDEKKQVCKYDFDSYFSILGNNFETQMAFCWQWLASFSRGSRPEAACTICIHILCVCTRIQLICKAFSALKLIFMLPSELSQLWTTSCRRIPWRQDPKAVARIFDWVLGVDQGEALREKQTNKHLDGRSENTAGYFANLHS